MLKVPKLYLDLKDISETSRDSWQNLQKAMSHIACGGGRSNKLFDDSCHKLLAAALESGKSAVVREINNPIDIIIP